MVNFWKDLNQSEIEEIRGVSLSRGTLDLLFEIGWIKPGKRLNVPGRPMTWEITNNFLDHFGLSNVSDLPGIQELKESGLLNTENKIFNDPKN